MVSLVILLLIEATAWRDDKKRERLLKAMNSTTELIDWYWSEIDVLRSTGLFSSESRYEHDNEGPGPCQCSTEKIVEDSSNPDQMRSFIMIGALIDQMMWTHRFEMYYSFSSVFRYPKLYSHLTFGMASPNWVAFTNRGYDEKVNWAVVSEVAQLLLNDLYQWFNREGTRDELSNFKERLKQEVSWEFESVNTHRLLPIIERIEHKQT